MMMNYAPKTDNVLYRLVRWLVWLFFPKMRVQGAENLPAGEPCVIVGNHCQMNGPITAELYSPVNRYTWCAGEMMVWREVHGYAFQDFWSQKPRWTHPFYRVLSYLITPLSVLLFNNAQTIPVYHDTRVLATFRESERRLAEGDSLVIFPEHDVKFNHVVYEFQERFVDVARLYYKKTGKTLAFVPLYVTPKLRLAVYGKPIRFDPKAPIAEERTRVCRALQREITALAEALPLHTVVPYRNIPKKYYPLNRQEAK